MKLTSGAACAQRSATACTQPPQAVTHCHCSQCQKSHGTAFAAYGAVPRHDLQITAGDTDLRAYASSAAVWRQFCGHCGSSLFWSRTQGDWSDWICIALGTLDSAFMPQQQKHVHVASKPTWSNFGAACAHGE
ncbi:GFA family protein [Comamonas aquatica]|uniref:GFA family protein n=1 Tax=Comamonas aquatica TaxID=225991 RepID=UPI0022DCE4D4|nr:GFA family protein [Comamonas aquatica]MDH1903892.1 GFA family protein [Comamonas aquatica]WBM43871.1 GFA family protein [Comamonas aquatica]